MRLDFATLSDPIQKNVGRLGRLGRSSIHAALIPPRLPGNSGEIWGETPAHVIEEQDERPDFSPISPNSPQPWGHGKPSIHAVSPISPISPRINTRTRLTEAFEERAAIMEFDGGLFRAEAERLAAESLGVGA